MGDRATVREAERHIGNLRSRHPFTDIRGSNVIGLGDSSVFEGAIDPSRPSLAIPTIGASAAEAAGG